MAAFAVANDVRFQEAANLTSAAGIEALPGRSSLAGEGSFRGVTARNLPVRFAPHSGPLLSRSKLQAGVRCAILPAGQL